jgi:hypothetical protein
MPGCRERSIVRKISNAEPAETFLHEIELLLPVLDDPWTEPLPPHRSEGRVASAKHRYVRHVFRNGDKQLPFRDIAPSRRTILNADNSPFAPENIRTRRSFFSVMVHRAITHHTPFLVEHQEVLFDNAEDFRSRLASPEYENEDASFFCDKSAYGRATRRTVDNAETLWMTSGRQKFNRWLLSDRPEHRKSFTDLLDLFDNSKAFPSVGKLTGYLMASDYAIAGVVDMPTLEELGAIVFDIGKGAMTGLRLLELQCETKEETIQAIAHVDKLVRDHFYNEELEKMDYNPFVLEHMLCKFRRLTTKTYGRTLED